MTAVDTELAQPPRASGEGDPAGTGHLEELRVDPIGLMERTRAECGDVGVFRLADRDVVLLTGRRGQRDLLPGPRRGPRPGRGLPVHDADLRRGRRVRRRRPRSAARRSTTRPCATSSCAATPRRSPPRSTGWSPHGADGGEIDLLDWFAELTIYTSSACLIGKRFREQLDGRFAHLYHDLERGTDAIAYVDPYADIESFRAPRRGPGRAGRAGAGDHGRPRRRAAAGRRRTATCSTSSCRSRTRTASLHFSADIITGMFISMMFAGHHTTSRHGGVDAHRAAAPPRLPRRGGRGARRPRGRGPRGQLPGPARDAEAGGRHQGGAAAAPAAHPPAARGQGAGGGRRLHDPAGDDGGGHARRCRTAIPQAFADAEAFDPDRYLEPREDDVANPWSWIPFGAGRHRCVGAAFAMMQLKAIFSVLLRAVPLRARPAPRDLPQRPLEDGRAARPALRRPDDPPMSHRFCVRSAPACGAQRTQNWWSA